MSDRVTVDKAALEAFIQYADETRVRCDQEVCCCLAEYEASGVEFQEFADALDQR